MKSRRFPRPSRASSRESGAGENGRIAAAKRSAAASSGARLGSKRGTTLGWVRPAGWGLLMGPLYSLNRSSGSVT